MQGDDDSTGTLGERLQTDVTLTMQIQAVKLGGGWGPPSHPSEGHSLFAFRARSSSHSAQFNFHTSVEYMCPYSAEAERTYHHRQKAFTEPPA